MFIAKYDSGDIVAEFTAEEERTDYGVPGSPILIDPDPNTVHVMSLEILGITVDPTTLPAPLLDALLDLPTRWERA